MNARMTMALCLCAIGLNSSADTTAWWHFNGENGASASSPLKDANGDFGLQLRKQGTATAKQVLYVSPTTGNVPVIGTSDAPEVLSEPVAGGIQFFIPSPALDSQGRSEMVGAYLLADPTKRLFGYGDSGKFPAFTIEMFIRVDPFQDAVNVQKGGGLFSIKRSSYDNSGNNVLTLEFVNAGNIQLRGDRNASGNGDRVHGTSSTMSTALRDGKWHRVAVVYSLPASGTGHFKVYCDGTCYIDVDVTDTAVPYLTTADTSGQYVASYFSIGDVANRHASLYVDEVRVSDRALEPDDFLCIYQAPEVSFLFPFGAYPANKEFMQSGITAVGNALASAKSEVSLNLKAGDCSYPCEYKYNFSGSASFVIAADQACLLARDAFTLEACFQTASAARQEIVAQGARWSLAIDGGALVWNHDGASVGLGGNVADGAWHQIAFVSTPVGEDARFDFYIDGALLGSVDDQAALPKMYRQDLVLGNGFVGSMLGYRVTRQALQPWKFERLSVVTGDKTLAAWTLDVDCSAGDVPLTSAVGKLPEVHGNSFYALTPGTYTSVTFNSGTTEEFGGSYLPTAVADVPAAWLWRADTKRILSAENLSSVRFRNACTPYDAASWNNNRTGGRLFSVSQGHGCGLKFTVEMFVKAERQFVNNYSLLVNQVSEGTKGRTWMLDAFQNRKLRLADTTVTDADVLGDGKWHHVALTYDAETNPTAITYGIYVDRQEISSGVCSVGSTIDPFNGGGTFNFGAATTSFAFYGLIDEPRVTAGVLQEESFMRAFVPRADLRGLWLANGASGVETFQGSALDYVNGTVEGDVADGSGLPREIMSLRASGQRPVRVGKTASFDGNGAVVIPAAAVVGASDFTIEAWAKGVGEIFRKERLSGNSLCLTVTADGGAEMAFDTFNPSYAIPDAAKRLKEAVAGLGLADGSWHHVALTCSKDDVGTYTVRLYADSALAATVPSVPFKLDGGDLVIGDGFVGEMCGFRFSPSALDVEAFLRLEEVPGMAVIVR